MPKHMTATAQVYTRFTVDDADEAGPITLEGLALPWGVTVQLNWWGDTIEFSRGSVMPAVAERVKFLLDHMNKPFGYGTKFEDREDGLWATVAIPRDELDDDAIAAAVRQMRNGVRDALSVGVSIDKTEHDSDSNHYVCTAGELLELSSVVIPRFSDARVARIAATQGGAMPPTANANRRLRADDDTETDTEPDETETTDDDGDEDEDEDRLENHRRATHRAGRHTAPTRARRGRYESFGHYALANAQGQVEAAYQQRLEAAWSDELTSDVPGIVPEQWMKEVLDLMGEVSMTVDLFSSAPLPDAGNTIHYPRVDQGPDIGKQAAEKTEIASRKVLIGDAALPVETFAGGQDISIQTILRSDPSYLNVLMGLYAKEMALQVNLAAGVAVIAGTTAVVPVDPTDLNATFIDAAAAILAGTFSFPQVALLGLNWWTTMGKTLGLDGRPLFPTLSPVNPVGSFNVVEAGGNVRGLTYAVDPSIDPDIAIVGLRNAFRTLKSPLRTLSADVPRLLGRDVAVFEFAAMGVLDGRGLVKMELPAAARSGSKKS